MSSSSKRRPALFFAFSLVALFSLLVALCTQSTVAGRAPLYLDYNHWPVRTTYVGPLAVVIVGPNPFDTKWTVTTRATTIPGPDLTKIFAAVPGFPTSTKAKSISDKHNMGGGNTSPCVDRTPPNSNAAMVITNGNNATLCIPVFEADVQKISSDVAALQTSEQDAQANVRSLLDQFAASQKPDAERVDDYAASVKACILVASQLSTCPQPSDGNVVTIAQDSKALVADEALAEADYAAYQSYWAANPKTADNPGATQDQDVVQTKAAYDRIKAGGAAALAAAPPNGVDTANGTALFAHPPDKSWIDIFVFETATARDLIACQGTLFNGTSVTYSLTVPTPAPSPSASTSPDTPAPPNPPARASLRAVKVVAMNRATALDVGYDGSSVLVAANTPKPKPSDQADSGSSPSPSPNPADRSVEVDCLPIAFVSAGFGADTVPNVSYTNVPANTALSGAVRFAPNVAATKAPGTIQQNAHGFRPVLTSLANFDISHDDAGTGWAYTIGAGLPLNNPGPGWKFEILTGPSFTIQRSLTITAGAAFGSINQLQTGYTLGGLIPAGMAPPTKTLNLQPGFFLSVNAYLTK